MSICIKCNFPFIPADKSGYWKCNCQSSSHSNIEDRVAKLESMLDFIKWHWNDKAERWERWT